MDTSGLLLDVDDDPQGETLREVFAGKAVPYVVKTASSLSPEVRERLPDGLFALVLTDRGRTLRKFACVDAANTVLSVIYFLKHAHKLPKTARTVAAQNLVQASEWYGVPVPEPLQKCALGALTALTALPVVTDAARQVKSNLGAVRSLERAGHTVVTPAMRASVLGPSPNGGVKAGEASATAPRPSPLEDLPAIEAFGPLVGADDDGPGPKGSQKRANVRALGDRYPMDNYVQVQAASRYFDSFHGQFAPGDRHDYATALVKRADALGIAVSDVARKCGAATYAPSAELLVSRDLRKIALAGQDADVLRGMLDALFEKRAELAPDAFCAALEEFDRLSGLDATSGIPDPYFSTYGVKTAAEDFTETIGADYVSGKDLERLARTAKESLEATFSDDFVEEFAKDPVGIFQSLPRSEKVVLMRMAADTVAA